MTLNPTVPAWARDLLRDADGGREIERFTTLKDTAVHKMGVAYASRGAFIVHRGIAGGEVFRLASPREVFGDPGQRFRCRECSTAFRVWRPMPAEAARCYACGSQADSVPEAAGDGVAATGAARAGAASMPSARGDSREQPPGDRWNLEISEPVDDPAETGPGSMSPREQAAKERVVASSIGIRKDAAAIDAAAVVDESRRIPFSDVAALEPEQVAALESLGIMDGRALAVADARAVAQATGARLEVVRVWQRTADLLMSTSLAPQGAGILAHAGVDGTTDLTRWKPESLAKEVQGVAREHGENSLTTAELRKAIDEARARYR